MFHANNRRKLFVLVKCCICQQHVHETCALVLEDFCGKKMFVFIEECLSRCQKEVCYLCLWFVGNKVFVNTTERLFCNKLFSQKYISLHILLFLYLKLFLFKKAEYSSGAHDFTLLLFSWSCLFKVITFFCTVFLYKIEYYIQFILVEK